MLTDHLGLSGCKLEIISDKIIRKYSSNKKYNNRLLIQIDKQNFFSNNTFTNLDTPKVVQKYQDDLIYFDMEYILGCNYYDFFSLASPNKLLNFFLFVDEYFDFLIKNSHKENSTIIKEKITNKLLSFKSSSLIAFTIDYLNTIDINIPKSFCHGDLTISNLLFHPKKVYLIDFLDSYIDSFLLDLVKLKQDLYYKWILDINDIQNLRINQCFNYLWSYIEKKYKPYLDSDIFKVLDLINFLRIEPYLTTAFQKNIINSKIKKTQIYEEFIDTHGREVL